MKSKTSVERTEKFCSHPIRRASGHRHLLWTGLQKRCWIPSTNFGSAFVPTSFTTYFTEESGKLHQLENRLHDAGAKTWIEASHVLDRGGGSGPGLLPWGDFRLYAVPECTPLHTDGFFRCDVVCRI